jgi:hypothetical protein
MSSPAVVIYLNDEKLKKWLKNEALKTNQSLSQYMVGLAKKEQSKKIKKNKLIRFAGFLNKKLSVQEIQVLDQVLEQVKKDNRSKPDKFYKDLND